MDQKTSTLNNICNNYCYDVLLYFRCFLRERNTVEFADELLDQLTQASNFTIEMPVVKFMTTMLQL